jgi:hypothetical protein
MKQNKEREVANTMQNSLLWLGNTSKVTTRNSG